MNSGIKKALGEIGSPSLDSLLLADAQRSRSVYLRAIDQVSGPRSHAYETFRSEVLDGVASLLLFREDQIDHAVPQRAVRLGLRAVQGVLDAEARAVTDAGKVDHPTHYISRQEKIVEDEDASWAIPKD